MTRVVAVGDNAWNLTHGQRMMDASQPPAARLHVILAREARTGVVFRRGPSKQVQLIRWDLARDTFTHGQWLKARVYERRCDLSPSGELLAYFAASNRGPYGSWTAVSRPPYFTALALWPKGDAWGGGGLFEDERTLLLNHPPVAGKTPFALAEGFQLQRGLRVRTLGEHAGRGEDSPIHDLRLARDGWRLRDEGEGRRGGRRAGALYVFARPHVMEKSNSGGLRLQAKLQAVGRRNAAWYAMDHDVLDTAGNVLLELPASDWADWDGQDLVFARGGGLYRLAAKDLSGGGPDLEAASRLLHDFSAARFQALEAPSRARAW